MLSSQAYSKSATQPCSFGELGGEAGPNAATAGLSPTSLPGFSPEQIDSLTKLFLAILSDPDPVPPTYVAVPGTHLKHKRNVRTRQQQKKKKAQAQAQRSTSQVQEVEHSYGQELEHLDVQISAEKTSKHVVLHRKAPWDWMATSSHALTPFVGIMMEPTIMIQNGAIRMPRMGVG